MTDLVEKVARAIWETENYTPMPKGLAPEDTVAYDQARAAIAVVLADLRAKADTTSRCWGHLWIESYARENGIEP